MATLATAIALDRRPSLTSTTSDDSPSAGDVEATTPPESPNQLPVVISRCNSATGEQEEPDVVAPIKPAFVLPPPVETRGRAEGKRKIGTLSMSRSMGSLRPKSKDPVERRPIEPSPAPSSSSTASSRPKPVKTNSFSAFFRKLVGGSSSTKSPKAVPTVVPTRAPAPVPIVAPRATPIAKPSLAIDTVMTPRSGSPVTVDSPSPTQVDPCEIPLPESPTPYNIALPASPPSSNQELPEVTFPLSRTGRSVSMNLAEISDEDEDDVASLSGMGSEESAPISPLPVTPATPVLIHRSSPQNVPVPQEFGGSGKVNRSPSRWRNSAISTSLPLRKPSRSAGPPPSSYEAYEAQQRRQASNRRSCQPTMHTRSTLAAETREVMDKEQEEMMERFFMS